MNQIVQMPSSSPELKSLSEWAWQQFLGNNDSSDQSNIKDTWLTTSKLLQKTLIECASKLDDSDYKTIPDLLPYWRGENSIIRFFKSLVAQAQLRIPRYKVESEMAEFIAEGESSFNYTEAQNLIKLWYQSV